MQARCRNQRSHLGHLQSVGRPTACLLDGAAGGGAAGLLAVDASWLDATGADGGVACLGGSHAPARFVVPAGGAFGAGGVVDASGVTASHVAIEPEDATAPAGETGGPAAEGPAADPSMNPTLKPAFATKTVTTTTVTNTTAAKASRLKSTIATTSSSLPKAGDNCRIAAFR